MLGKQYAPSEITHLSQLFNTWVMGLFTPFAWNHPLLQFLPYPKALRAREVRFWSCVSCERSIVRYILLTHSSPCHTHSLHIFISHLHPNT